MAKCKFCGAEVEIGFKCGYCGSIAERWYYPLTLIFKRKPVGKIVQDKDIPKSIPTFCGEVGCSYIVVAGDTLWGISKRFYGSGSLYPIIVEANNIKNPNLIYPEQKLIIPRMERY